MATVPVQPAVLRWARADYIGLDAEGAARIIKIKVDELRALESGARQPSLSLLKRIAKAYNLPLATLAMPAALPVPSKPKDYRTLEGRVVSISPLTAIAIRTAQGYADAIGELLQIEQDLGTALSVKRVTLEDDPYAIARRERSEFAIGLDDQVAWPDDRTAFRIWRDEIERRGIFVYVLDFPLNDCRGFSDDRGMPIIVVNKNEYTYAARTFTLFHEYYHILLNKPGISNLNDRNAVERLCNRFAAEFLAPIKDVSKYLDLSPEPAEYDWPQDALRKIAVKLKISQRALALRLETSGYATKGFYESVVRDQENKTPPGEQSKKGFVNLVDKQMMRFGARHTYSVLSAHDRDSISGLDVYRMVGIPPRQFDVARSRLKNRRMLPHGTPSIRPGVFG